MYTEFVAYVDHKVSCKPAPWHSSAIIMAAPGSRSEGFRITVFPVTIAKGIDQRGIMLGSILFYLVHLIGC